ncbi:hypothetical protein K438DRAFT_1807716 [Mycena galopus ATCC 62051]|nr:hypothetical protein K438DRAFT_1807716 [Mycena galopus ATCC 62051]
MKPGMIFTIEPVNNTPLAVATCCIYFRPPNTFPRDFSASPPENFATFQHRRWIFWTEWKPKSPKANSSQNCANIR